MIGRVERTIRQSIQEHDAILIGAFSKMGGTVAVGDTGNREADTAELPEESEKIPEEVLDFLGGF